MGSYYRARAFSLYIPCSANRCLGAARVELVRHWRLSTRKEVRIICSALPCKPWNLASHQRPGMTQGYKSVETGSFVNRSLNLDSSGCTPITTTLPWESKKHLTSAGMTCFDLDVTNDESVQTLAIEVKKLTDGRLHVLVNNA